MGACVRLSSLDPQAVDVGVGVLLSLIFRDSNDPRVKTSQRIQSLSVVSGAYVSYFK